MKQHNYQLALTWTGNHGSGTSSYRDYARDHEIQAGSKAPIAGSSDPQFRGDPRRWSPEELLVASLSACHQLWYLHLCADAGVVVVAYEDQPQGIMIENAGGDGQFVSVVLHPHVTISPESDASIAERLHHEAHAKCFIARSVNFPVTHQPTIANAAAAG
jgi:organic hydroperoxide reductase OsmC/OhrA